MHRSSRYKRITCGSEASHPNIGVCPLHPCTRLPHLDGQHHHGREALEHVVHGHVERAQPEQRQAGVGGVQQRDAQQPPARAPRKLWGARGRGWGLGGEVCVEVGVRMAW